jgi:hypothetical protein
MQQCQIIVKYICLWDEQSVGTHWMLARCCEIQAIEKAMRVQSMVRFLLLLVVVLQDGILYQDHIL